MASTTASTAHPAVICAENSALLHLLHEIPASPSRNNKADYASKSTGHYSLSFEQERTLTGVLAFLAGSKDGPEYIPGICVEEDQEEGRLNVLIAVNKKKPGEGNTVLEEIQYGFNRIFALLQNISSSKLGTVEDCLLKANCRSSRQSVPSETIVYHNCCKL